MLAIYNLLADAMYMQCMSLKLEHDVNIHHTREREFDMLWPASSSRTHFMHSMVPQWQAM